MKTYRLRAPVLALRQSEDIHPHLVPLPPSTCLVLAEVPRASGLVNVQDIASEYIYTLFHSDLMERSEIAEVAAAS